MSQAEYRHVRFLNPAIMLAGWTPEPRVYDHTRPAPKLFHENDRFHRYPRRKVVKRVWSRPPSAPGHKTCVCTLECGHLRPVTVNSWNVGKTYRCRECPTVEVEKRDKWWMLP